MHGAGAQAASSPPPGVPAERAPGRRFMNLSDRRIAARSTGLTLQRHTSLNLRCKVAVHRADAASKASTSTEAPFPVPLPVAVPLPAVVENLMFAEFGALQK